MVDETCSPIRANTIGLLLFVVVVKCSKYVIIIYLSVPNSYHFLPRATQIIIGSTRNLIPYSSQPYMLCLAILFASCPVVINGPM